MNKKKLDIRMEGHKRYLDSINSAKYESTSVASETPNVVVILCDDMGYGDIGCFGSTVIETPHLDQLAKDGIRFNNFYAASPVCSPSRFSLLTGRYPNRNFIDGVFFPTRKDIKGEQSPWKKKVLHKIAGHFTTSSRGVKGILPDEVTIAEVLQQRGYKTGIFGKWHLGDDTPYLPNEKGFDYFFGSYYSNDMIPYAYFRNEKQVMTAPVDQTKLTGILTEEIKTFITENKDNPFFVYYPSPFPHFPVHASESFQGKSKGGAYGDCVEEIDWSVGEIVKELEAHGLRENTLVVFSSDNGPWFEGSPGLHRGRKGNNFDGGQAVPLIASWPATLRSDAVTDEMAMNIDLFPTVCDMIDVDLPSDRIIDGKSLLSLIKGEDEKTPHDELMFVGPRRYFAIRDRHNFKYFSESKVENAKYNGLKQGPFLFDLTHDTNESYDVGNRYPEIKQHLAARLDQWQKDYDTNPRGWINKN